MRRQMRKRLVTAALALALAAGSGAPGAQAGGTGDGGSEPFVPFVTDFGRSLSPAPAEPFVPFVTDFGGSPSPAPAKAAAPTEPVIPAAEAARSWKDVALGAGLGVAFATLLGGGLLAARSRRPAGALRHEAGS